jgi:probable HAF family extracellular repeat protein
MNLLIGTPRSVLRFATHKGQTAVFALAFGLLFYLTLHTVDAQVRYSITQLVPMVGITSEASGINSQGDVVGFYYWRSTQAPHPFLWHAGIFHDLGSFQPASVGTGIDNFGRVIGWGVIHDGTIFAFKYYRGQYTQIGEANAVPGSVNNSAHIVGSYENGNGGLGSGWIWQGSKIAPIPRGVFQDLIASALNDSDSVTGWGLTKGVFHAFLYRSGTMQDLGTLGGNTSLGTAINNNGQIVGYSLTGAGSKHAFLYDGTGMHDIDALSVNTGDSTQAFGINNSGQVVGLYISQPSGTLHPFIYQGGKMQELENLIPPNSGWTLGAYSVNLPYAYNVVMAINDAGQIIGSGVFNGLLQAYLLTPIQ